MQVVRVKFKRVEVLKIDTMHNALHLNFVFEEGGIERSVKKNIDLRDDNTSSFVRGVYSDIRGSVSTALDSDDPWENLINVVFVEKNNEDMEDRLSVAVKRLKEKIKNFRTNKTSDGYLNRWSDMKELKIEL